MDAMEKQIRKRLKDDFIHYASKCLKIRSKSGQITPFILNKPQTYIHEKVENQKREFGRVRVVILKGRQEGCSTYVEGRFYWIVTHHFGMLAFILTHDSDATNNLFEMAQRYHEHCPAVIKPALNYSNAKELIFGSLDSGYKVGTAGNKTVGRSSTIQLLHGSEVAYWPNASEHAKGILQAVPLEKNTEVFIESTANGIGNYFHEQWQLAESKESDFMPIFIPWYWQDEYKRELIEEEHFVITEEEEMLVNYYKLTIPQLNWRRYKIKEFTTQGNDGLKSFMQEYPCNPQEAFQHSGENNFIHPEIVMAARKCNVEPVGQLLIGVDPARFGDDRTSIIRRRGRVAYNLQSYSKKDTMEVCGLINRIITDEKPTKVLIDIGGLGAGVYDRLKELGHGDLLVSVNGGNSPLDQELYINKRAEMWGLLKEWLADAPCQIPDDDCLHADLCNIKYKYDSKTRLLMEKKEDMKKRGIRSPDTADALALTFALPDKAIMTASNENAEREAKNIMSGINQIDRLKKAAYS